MLILHALLARLASPSGHPGERQVPATPTYLVGGTGFVNRAATGAAQGTSAELIGAIRQLRWLRSN